MCPDTQLRTRCNSPGECLAALSESKQVSSPALGLCFPHLNSKQAAPGQEKRDRQRSSCPASPRARNQLLLAPCLPLPCQEPRGQLRQDACLCQPSVCFLGGTHGMGVCLGPHSRPELPGCPHLGLKSLEWAEQGECSALLHSPERT